MQCVKCGWSRTLKGIFQPHMPGIPSTFVFSQAGKKAPPFPRHAGSMESYAAVVLHLASISGPRSTGNFWGGSNKGI